MKYLLALVVLSVPIVYISRKALLKPGSHGFFRFFSWEAILVLLVVNAEYWFYRPFSVYQVISWILLIISLYLVISGFLVLKKKGNNLQIVTIGNSTILKRRLRLLKPVFSGISAIPSILHCCF